jgi:hypothetical protein
MKRHVSVGIAVYVVLSSVCSSTAFGQEDLAPPKTARFCNVEAKACNTLTWAGEYYEGRNEGDAKVVSRFWITEWGRDGVEMNGKTAYAVQNGFPLEAFFHGKIAPDGVSLQGGTFEWRVGYGSSGAGTFTFTWSKAASNRMTDLAVGQFQSARHSQTNPNILLPPGAAEEYASYPDVVRAILLPETGITPGDAKRACNDPFVNNPATALEVARYAYRQSDRKRGDCWLQTSMKLGSMRAKVVYATTFLYGWQGTPKDEPKGFGILKANVETKDPWDIWLLTQCYIDGTGTPKDPQQAAILTAYTLKHDDAYQVSQLVGADDEELVANFQKMSVMMNPPTTTKTQCQMVPVPGGNGEVRQSCRTSSTVDEKALEEKLDNVDRDRANKAKANP